MRSDRLGETLLPKKPALPVFCSDPLSPVAYATEQIVLVLGLGGLALLGLAPWLAAAVVLLLIVVVASYETETNYLRVYLAQLRRKLEPDPQHPRYLITEPGMGYRFTRGAA